MSAVTQPSALQADKDLVAAVLEGRPRAVDEFIERMNCVPRILRAINARLGSPLSAEDLVDLTQDTLIISWRKLTGYDGRSSLESWTYGIAWFELSNAMRRKRRQPTPFAELPEGGEQLPLGEGNDVDQERIRIGLSRLEPVEETLLRKRHFEDLTFEELALQLGMTTSATKSRYYRGLEKLRLYLGADPDGEQR